MSSTTTEAPKPETRPKLPEGWRWVRLGQVSEILAGQSPPSQTYRKSPEGLPFFQGKADFGNKHPVARVWCVSPKRVAEPGDILISVRAPVGPTNIADQKCCIGRGLAAIRVAEGADRDYIFWALKRFELDIASKGSGSTFDSLPIDELRDFYIPLPPLETQRRIAAILTEQMEAVEKARKAAEEGLEAARKLTAAHLRAVFESEEVLSWPTVPLVSVGEIASGITLGRKLNGQVTRSVPYLRVANVKDGHLDLSDVYTIEATEQEINKWRLQIGDLLLTEGGDPDKLGRGTYWSGEIEECIHQNHIFRVRLDATRCLPEFASAEISSTYGKGYFLKHAKQTTGIATINQRVLANFPLRLPTLETQHRIVAELNTKLEATQALIRSLEAQLEAIRALPAAILRRAFSGEL